MPDPEGIYSSALGATDISNSGIEPPNVLDGSGGLIQPEEYDKRLEMSMKVSVNVHMKMWVWHLSSNSFFLKYTQVDIEA